MQAIDKIHNDRMAKEKAEIERRHNAQLQAVQESNKAAALIAVDGLRLELEAYKEPWAYL